jgi:hypothetical protein
MKKTNLLLVFLLIITNHVIAAVFTVNNSPAGGAQYSQINAAISAASTGDTIYVNGSSATYADATITKSLTLIGAGTFSPKQAAFPTTISTINLASGVSNVTIKGFNIGSSVSVSGNSNVSFVTISDNFFSNNCFTYAQLNNVHDIVITNNIQSGNSYFCNVFNNGGCYNFLISNNLINGYIENFNFPSSTIQNNTFYNGGNAFGGSTTAVSGCVIKNNIFYNSHPTNGTSSCIFLNNITYSTSVTYPALGGSNIDNTNPQLINVANSGGYSTTYNFTVASTSPAHLAGTDGTDLGYYGGVLRASKYGEVYNLPVVREMDVTNTSVIQGGAINVKVRSTKAR